MNKLTAGTLFAALVALLLFAACEQGEKMIFLKYKYAPGLTLVYEQDMHRSVQILKGDSTIEKSSNKFNVRVLQAVEEVSEDNVALIRETDSWSYTEPSKADSTRLDTVRIERTMLITVLPNGDIVDVEFVDETSEPTRAYIKNFLEQGMPVFPTGEITPGFSWTQTAKVLLPNETMEASTTYKFTALVREAGYDCALLEHEGNLVIPLEPSPSDSVVRIGVDRIHTTGKMYFAYKEGMVILQRERWVIDGDHQTIRKGDTTSYTFLVEADVNFALQSRTLVE